MRDPKHGLMALLASVLLLAGGAAVSAGAPASGAPPDCEPAPAQIGASAQAAPAFGWWTLYDDRRVTT